MNLEFLNLIEICGIISFSMSGVLAAWDKKLDVFGIFIIAFITAMGGGTLRDILIGDLPVNWMLNTQNGVVVLVSAAIAIPFHKAIGNFQKVLLVFDSLGLGLFTVVGIEKGIDFGFSPGICVALGIITGCFGGVIRDISINNIPLIFQKEIYASACIIGGIMYFLLQPHIATDVLDIIIIVIIFMIRMLAVKLNFSLPDMYAKKKPPPLEK